MSIGDSINRIQKLIEARHLLHPLDGVPSSMALFHAVASLCGYTAGLTTTAPGDRAAWFTEHASHVKELREAIGHSDHYVFVLVDGLGLNLKASFPKDGFFDSFYHTELRSIFPSTTASVLTSLATGLWPARHAIPGWNVYLPGRARTIKPVLFRDRITEKPLRRFGVTPEEVYPFSSIVPEFLVESRTYLPSGIVRETFASYCRGDTPFSGYSSISNAIKKIITHVKQSGPSAYTYLYLPQVDKAIHKHGLASEKVLEEVTQVDEHLMRLKEEVGDKARVIVTADHGLIDVRRDAYLTLRDEDDLLQYLLVAPTGESRLPFFHLKEGAEDAFLQSAERTLGKHFSLVPRDGVERMKLFGPNRCSSEMKSRLGDYIGIPVDSAVLEYVPSGKSSRNFSGFHGGLSADEMRLPLFLS